VEQKIYRYFPGTGQSKLPLIWLNGGPVVNSPSFAPDPPFMSRDIMTKKQIPMIPPMEIRDLAIFKIAVDFQTCHVITKVGLKIREKKSLKKKYLYSF